MNVTDIFEAWYTDFVAQGGSRGRGVDYIVNQAQAKALQYREMGTSYADFQPGNGTSYTLVLHDMVAPYVRLMVERDHDMPLEPGDESWLQQLGIYIHRNQMREADLWRYAFDHTMAGRAGGELLVSLPENNGGVCASFSVHTGALLTPDYVTERLGCRMADSLPLAVYLTAFVNAVAAARAEAGVPA